MTRRLIDIIGKRFGCWTAAALRPERSRSGEAVWICYCDCGTKREVTGSSLRRGNSTNCGCLQREDLRRRNTKHGHAARGRETSAHRRWAAMLRRCLNPNTKDYCNYGARGIAPCEAWLEFKSYYADTGDPPPGKWLDRIDNDGNYEPGNWQWATPTEQARNRRPPKRKRRRSTVKEIQAFVASMKRAASAPGERGAP